MNQTYIEPMISYNFESGWYADIDPQMTYDWTADAANAWTIPMGADVGKAFNIGSQSLSLQVGRLRPAEASGWRPAMDNARERNVPFPGRLLVRSDFQNLRRHRRNRDPAASRAARRICTVTNRTTPQAESRAGGHDMPG